MKLQIGIMVFILAGVLGGCTKNNATPLATVFNCNAQTSVTYALQVKAILDQHCALSGCHLGVNSSGIYLDTYPAAKTNFQAGNAFCTLHHNAGCKAMPYPPSSDKLPDSLIAIVDCWKQKGFPN